ncbi:MAG: prepilin-type N-terminal cleavage/methylation domain-containing protein [Verrucomicrobiota bacterium]
MKPVTFKSTCQAFTLIELLVVMVIIGVMLAMLLPASHKSGKASTIVCMNNLKQVGLGLMMYASDHADHFPWQLSTNSAVTGEAMERRTAAEHFLVLSHYAFPSSIFVCPTDKARRSATNYSCFHDTNLSYFAALSATVTTGSNVWQLILAGDQHLSVDGQPAKPGLCTLNNKSVPGWTEEFHNSDPKVTRGCLLFVDGHVQFVPAKVLPRLFKNQPVETSRLVIP